LGAFEFANHFFETREAALEVGLFGWIGFFWCWRVHVFFAANSLRQGEDEKQVESLDA
jgi:hypothetical protein